MSSLPVLSPEMVELLALYTSTVAAAGAARVRASELEEEAESLRLRLIELPLFLVIEDNAEALATVRTAIRTEANAEAVLLADGRIGVMRGRGASRRTVSFRSGGIWRSRSAFATGGGAAWFLANAGDPPSPLEILPQDAL